MESRMRMVCEKSGYHGQPNEKPRWEENFLTMQTPSTYAVGTTVDAFESDCVASEQQGSVEEMPVVRSGTLARGFPMPSHHT
jgi:hypothetical protein